MKSPGNLGYAPVICLDILDKRDSIVVYVDKVVVEQTIHKYLIPTMRILFQGIDEVSALQRLGFRYPVACI